MGYYSTIEINFKLEKIKTKEDLFKVLDEHEKKFLED